MKVKAISWIVVAGVGCWLGDTSRDKAYAQEVAEPIITDRPDFTESPQTVPAGRVQVEGGYTYERSGPDRTHTFGELLVRVATGQKSELRIGVPSYMRQIEGGVRGTGVDDAFLGAKFALSPGSGQVGLRKPALGLIIGSTLPTGSRAVAERKWQPEVVLTASVDLSDKVSLSSNIGYARPTDGGTRLSQFLGSASLGFSLSDKLGAYTEVYGLSEDDVTGNSKKYVNGGLTYLLNPDFQLDVRAGLGINNKAGGPDYFFGLGAARRF